MANKKRQVSFIIDDYRTYNIEQINNKITYFDKKIDRLSLAYKESFSTASFSEYFGCILNIKYLLEAIKEFYPEIDEDINNNKKLNNLKNSLGILDPKDED